MLKEGLGSEQAVWLRLPSVDPHSLCQEASASRWMGPGGHCALMTQMALSDP